MKVHVSFARLGCLVAVLVLAGLGGYLALNGALNTDEGFYLLASRLVSEGYRPYADFGYTQGPVLPYVNVPWLAVFGYNLAGLRLASLAWTLITIITGVLVLRGRGTWTTATVFAVLLLGAPVWLEFAVKGKSYAFTGLAVLAGVLALTGRWPLWLRWACFIGAAALGTGARYPTAGFFVPAWFCLLLLTPGWRSRGFALLATGACAAGLLMFAAAGEWDRLFYWTVGFHLRTTFAFSRLEQFWYFLLFAPAIWLAAGFSLWRLDGGAGRASRMALGALVLGVVANLAGHTTYAEYVFPLVPATAFVVAPVMSSLLARIRASMAVLLVPVLLACAWIHPPELNRDLLRNANEASAFLHAHVATDNVVACSMPEIPAASGNRVPLSMAMGKFSVTEDLDPALAARMHMLTPSALLEVLRDPATQALVISPVFNWNFFWSLPSYQWLSEKARGDLKQTVEQYYMLGYANADYVVLLRRP
jgi:hypothetical protein